MIAPPQSSTASDEVPLCEGATVVIQKLLTNRRPTLKDKRWPYHWKYVQPSGQWQNKLEWVIVKIVKQQKKDKANDATIQNIQSFSPSFNLVLLWFPDLHSLSSNFRSLPKS